MVTMTNTDNGKLLFKPGEKKQTKGLTLLKKLLRDSGSRAGSARAPHARSRKANSDQGCGQARKGSGFEGAGESNCAATQKPCGEVGADEGAPQPC